MISYRDYRNKWKECKRCSLWKTRKRIVLAKGTIPAPILFIGEAPGDSENDLGMPFVGPAGHLLDYIIEESIGSQYPMAFTNLVACIPRINTIDPESQGNGLKFKGKPSKESIEACRPRLLEFIQMCYPRLMVKVGKLSNLWAPEFNRVSQVSIFHPAAILRADLSQKPIMVKRCIVIIKEAVEVLGDYND